MNIQLTLPLVGFLGALGLLGVGLYGLLASHHLIKIIVALQILVKAAILAIVVAGKISGQVNLGQSLAATVIVVDTVAAVVGLALVVEVNRRFGTLDIRALTQLRE